jgi:hypothetical protein
VTIDDLLTARSGVYVPITDPLVGIDRPARGGPPPRPPPPRNWGRGGKRGMRSWPWQHAAQSRCRGKTLGHFHRCSDSLIDGGREAAEQRVLLNSQA